MNKIEVTMLIDPYGSLQIWRGHHDLVSKYTSGNIYHAADTGEPSHILVQDSGDIRAVTTQLSQDEQLDLDAGWTVKTEIYEGAIPCPGLEDLVEAATLLQPNRYEVYAWQGHVGIVRTPHGHRVSEGDHRPCDKVINKWGEIKELKHTLPHNAIDHLEAGYAIEITTIKGTIRWDD